MTISPDQAARFRDTFELMVANIGQAVLGKEHVVRLALTCLVTGGHLLLEDYPGTGKTSLARAVARTVQGSHARIQFTPDLLPTDVTGVQVYDQASRRFEFMRGPIFHSIVLADEINRASPKTQSALLEVMDEGRVTVDGVSHDVGRPFMVIATQNPVEQAGTYPLPEAQLDRFLMKTNLDYPDHDAMVELLRDAAVRDRAADVQPKVSAEILVPLGRLADAVTVRTETLAYVSRLAEATRRHKHTKLGVSARGCLAYVRCAKTWAIAHGRTFVTPDDIRALAYPVLSHRIQVNAEAQFDGVTVEQVVNEVFTEIAAPLERVA
jgi:MoxR-like ATPase